jgi:hypothetical protein
VVSVLSSSSSSAGDPLDGRRLRRYRHADGVAQHGVGQPGDLLRHGGREEQSLAFAAQHGDDALDVMDEAHVEHAVGFVQHQDFHLVERHGALVDQIEQTARRCHQHFDAVGERAHLAVDRHAANGERDRERPHVPSIGAEAVRNLARQFAGRRQHQDAAGLLFRPQALGIEVIQDRQREGRGLARAGLRDADDVAALQHDGNGLILDRGGSYVFFVHESAIDRLSEAKVVK